MNKATIQGTVSRRAVRVFTLIFVWACLAITTVPTRQQVQGAELNTNAATLLFDVAGADGAVSALAGEGDYVYAGGSFSTIGGVKEAAQKFRRPN